ncbi:glycosyl transferase family 2 [Ilumatobacter fluminis]|uniref:Glycosyl transferase family 2 n=1 Tax=Ilumatobacter fluminis TaxID=467091 RepID=A0A4V3EJC6_9ACTN|nr:glycosyltransferase family 2 protein [Ilumatobacter fluminis]TDT17818.1 glycosyl transferase family 2 [Ilumatobacter fluminis]
MGIPRTVKRLLMPAGLVLGSFEQHEPEPARMPEPLWAEPDETLPTIGVVMPTMNQATFIARSIDSVLDQDYPRLTMTVQDGGSTDGTVDIVRAYAESGRLTVESGPDDGQSDAINRGMARIDTDIVAWLNSDDLSLPGALVTVGRYFRDHPDVDVVYGHRIVLDDRAREVGRWVLPRHSRGAYQWRCYITQETMFWRRSLHERIGGIDDSFQFAMDWDLVCRMADAGARFERLPRFLGGFTTHAAQKSLAWRESIGEPEFDRIRRRTLPTRRARVTAMVGGARYLVASVPMYWRHRHD